LNLLECLSISFNYVADGVYLWIEIISVYWEAVRYFPGTHMERFCSKAIEGELIVAVIFVDYIPNIKYGFHVWISST